MRNSILLFLIILNLKCFSQAFPLKIFIKKADRIDSVLFGLNIQSSLGLDYQLGENNIISSPLDSLDMRVIKRDSAHYNCLNPTWDTAHIYSENNYDLKVDYRPPGPFTELNNNFEIVLKSDFFPYQVIGDFSNIGMFRFGSQMVLLDSLCHEIKRESINPYQTPQVFDTLENSKKYYLLVHLEHEVGVERIENKFVFKIYPNPANDELTVEPLISTYYLVQIFDISGKKVKEIKSRSQLLHLDIGDFQYGIYIVRIKDESGSLSDVKIFFKSPAANTR